ncbi:hypothetical protein GWI33_016334 [Rhynchophorus ferrugineus]|uniref:Uncharacterized protein n=1 Tax=Rhynchophorus ferrugineus TaxID=354439 RepID=A0A834HXL4_RHYFE|nr:hypothetical protein GWI33_016334 [Rhynchophorus ferrugineus]
MTMEEGTNLDRFLQRDQPRRFPLSAVCRSAQCPPCSFIPIIGRPVRTYVIDFMQMVLTQLNLQFTCETRRGALSRRSQRVGKLIKVTGATTL